MTIVHTSKGYYVHSEKGKNLGGPYATRRQALTRLRQVEYFKHHAATATACCCCEYEEDDSEFRICIACGALGAMRRCKRCRAPICDADCLAKSWVLGEPHRETCDLRATGEK